MKTLPKKGQHVMATLLPSITGGVLEEEEMIFHDKANWETDSLWYDSSAIKSWRPLEVGEEHRRVANETDGYM